MSRNIQARLELLARPQGLFEACRSFGGCHGSVGPYTGARGCLNRLLVQTPVPKNLSRVFRSSAGFHTGPSTGPPAGRSQTTGRPQTTGRWVCIRGRGSV